MITNCYTGGEITCTDACLNASSRLMLAGISGGIYIKNGGNLLELLGNSILGINWSKVILEESSEQCRTPTTIIKTVIPMLRCQVVATRRRLLPLNQSAVTEKHMMKNIKTGEKVIIM